MDESVGLSDEELWNRLDLVDDATLDDLYDVGFRQLASEDAKTARVDAKAAAFFGVTGFSMTLAISFGGWSLLDNARKVPGGWLISVAFIGLLIVGVITGWHALAVLKVRRFRTVDEAMVFARDVLEKRSKREFRMQVAGHVWFVARENFSVNEKKVDQLEACQKWFLGFLGGVLALSIMVVASALSRDPESTVQSNVTVTCLPSGSVVAALIPIYDGGVDAERTQTAATSTTGDAADEHQSSPATD